MKWKPSYLSTRGLLIRGAHYSIDPIVAISYREPFPFALRRPRENFPESKFILTISDPDSWHDSYASDAGFWGASFFWIWPPSNGCWCSFWCPFENLQTRGTLKKMQTFGIFFLQLEWGSRSTKHPQIHHPRQPQQTSGKDAFQRHPQSQPEGQRPTQTTQTFRKKTQTSQHKTPQVGSHEDNPKDTPNTLAKGIPKSLKSPPATKSALQLPESSGCYESRTTY